MYQLELNMGLADFAITRAIEELSQEHESFGAVEIAARIGCGVTTVKRRLPHLKEAGVIVRKGDKRNYRYEFIRSKYAKRG